ncbi:DHHC palmitoyltransferase-domain-containing protein [Immersiella caudata]|uniref:Palmitoyltransferase n=1 Tax=Immersiella caudata TaxID=314043 RepID=A0AA39XGI6_9PEZI|nr:DHHC palmitoyltransferase-domain-containing protein [Immersiella caudata]
MASPEDAARSASPSNNVDVFPQFPRSEIPGPPSIISSRMTDIGTDDGRESDGQRAGTAGQRRSAFYQSDGQSRPGTARTGVSSRGPPQNLRRGLSGKRVSGTGSASGSAMGHRPASSTSRSHVPSLTSHAFFRPMSSQKLQAQRGATRPSTMTRPQISSTPGGFPIEEDQDLARQSIISNSPLGIGAHVTIEVETRPPPSRGTEMTEQDRITANTSPTHGHNATASITDSVRPLQRKQVEGRKLTVNVDKGFKGGNLPTPVRTPRSFRSSFLLPSQQNGNREIEGGEKLESVASSPQLPPENQKTKPVSKKEKIKSKLGHNHEYFEGNTVFCLGGRWQNSRQRPVNIATGSFVVIPSLLYFIFSASWIWHNISPAIPITFAYLFYICMSSFIHASVTDPGILPRNLHRFPPVDANEDPLRLGPPTNDWTLVKSAEKTAAAMEVPTKYCKTCNLWRPPRAHHCRLCDNCVETQDHHCVWLNNCVGRRNYRYFFTFITSTSLLALYLLGASLAQILVYSNQQGVSFGDSIDKNRVPFAMVIYGFLGFLYPASLMGYHVFLIARGETTREYLNSHKFLKKDRYRAFTQGNWFKNWWVVLCRPRPPTYYGFKGSFEQGDQRFGEAKRAPGTGGNRSAPIDSKEGMEMQDVRTTNP